MRVGDAEWQQTVQKGDYKDNPIESELGRRILVTWETTGMPPGGQYALVPQNERPPRPLSTHTIERLSAETFQKLCAVLSNPSNWIQAADVEDLEIEVPPAPSVEMALWERDLQRFLSRNLAIIEAGLSADPGYQLQEYSSDVGRMDFLCRDARNNWVVIELKADLATDDAVGQILGYMSWVRDNLPDGSTVRGILVCKDATGRVKAAAKWIPSLCIKRFDLNCSIENMA